MATVLSALKVRVCTLSAKAAEDGSALVSVEVEVKDKAQLQQVINKMSQIRGVSTVKRVTG